MIVTNHNEEVAEAHVTSQLKGAKVTRDKEPPHPEDTRSLYIALTNPASSFDQKKQYIKKIRSACKRFKEVEFEGKKNHNAFEVPLPLREAGLNEGLLTSEACSHCSGALGAVSGGIVE